MNDNKILDVLFDTYTSDMFPKLKSVHYDDVEEIDKKIEAFEQRVMLNYEEKKELYGYIMEYGNICEKRGFICGMKLGTALMKEMGAGV